MPAASPAEFSASWAAFWVTELPLHLNSSGEITSSGSRARSVLCAVCLAESAREAACSDEIAVIVPYSIRCTSPALSVA